MSKKKPNKKNLIGSLLLLVLLIAVIIYFYFFHNFKKSTTVDNEKTNQAEKCDWQRRLDGVCVQNETDTNLWLVAVMIDNHPDSWPQFGLSAASLVYNTLVEGGSTRLMAIYAGNEAEKIGPVRSARPYYLTWAKELDALYAHSGGSPAAIQKIKEYQILDLEEATSYGPLYFYRDHSGIFYSPHNLFTSSERLLQALKDFKLATSTPVYEQWQFNKKATSTQEAAQEIYIDYSAGILFDVAYKYSTSSQSYLRFQNEKPFIDALSSRQIEVKNLIIQFVPAEIHLDAEDRLRLNSLGEGETWIFYAGKLVRGKWVKNNLTDRTKFYDQQGKEIIFLPGNIWIEVVPGSREVKINK